MLKERKTKVYRSRRRQFHAPELELPDGNRIVFAFADPSVEPSSKIVHPEIPARTMRATSFRSSLIISRSFCIWRGFYFKFTL
jgi:hypothetical protein